MRSLGDKTRTIAARQALHHASLRIQRILDVGYDGTIACQGGGHMSRISIFPGQPIPE